MSESQPVTTGKVLVDVYGGVTLVVTPLTLQARQLLLRASEAKYPMPDPASYERTAEDVEVFGSDKPATVPAQDNPEYIAKVAEVEALRTRHLNEAVLRVSVDHPEKVFLIKTHAESLQAMREQTPDEVPDDDWVAVIRLFLASEPELAQLYGVINRLLPLAEAEVREAVRYFRLAVQGQKLRRIDGQSRSSRAASAESDSA